jgi:hypothetical protein
MAPRAASDCGLPTRARIALANSKKNPRVFVLVRVYANVVTGMLARSLQEDASKMANKDPFGAELGVGRDVLFTQLRRLRLGYGQPIFQHSSLLEKLTLPERLFFFWRLAYKLDAHAPCLRVLLKVLAWEKLEKT